jgi:hypothetical protein
VILEKVVLTAYASLRRSFDEGLEEALGFVRLAMVGIQGDENVITFSKAMGRFGKDDASEGGVFVG